MEGWMDAETHKPPDAPTTSAKTFQAEIDAFMKGKAQLPNFEELPLDRGVAVIAASGGLKTVPGVKTEKMAGRIPNGGHGARSFLGTPRGGALDGTGYVM